MGISFFLNSNFQPDPFPSLFFSVTSFFCHAGLVSVSHTISLNRPILTQVRIQDDTLPIRCFFPSLLMSEVWRLMSIPHYSWNQGKTLSIFLWINIANFSLYYIIFGLTLHFQPAWKCKVRNRGGRKSLVNKGAWHQNFSYEHLDNPQKFF